jgi:uncharacterized membrane protein
MEPDASRSDEPSVGDPAPPSAAVAPTAGYGTEGEERLAGEPESAERKYGHLHPLTLLSRAAGLLLLEGASVGLFFWEAFTSEALRDYVRSNKLPSQDRRSLILYMVLGAAFFLLAGLVTLVRRRRSAPIPLFVASMRLAPVSLAAFLPLLFNWRLWENRNLPYLALLSLVALGAQRAAYLYFLAGSLPGAPAREAGSVLNAMIRGISARLRAASSWLPSLLVTAFFTWYATFFSYYTVLNHRSLRTASFDLGLEHNIIWNALHGGHLIISSPLCGPGCSHFGYHATFFSYIVALFYAPYQQAETLLVFQAIVIAAAAFPLFFYARRQIGAWPACLIACMYLLYAPVHGSNLYDFHYPPLAALFIWSVLYFVEEERYRWAAVAVLLSLSVREDMSIGVAIIGAFFVLTGHRSRAGLLLALIGVSYFVTMKFFVMPRALGAPAFAYFYQQLLPEGETGFTGILKTIFGNPVFTLSKLLEREKLVYFLQIMAPLAFLPWRRPIGWLFIVPGLLFTLLSTGYKPTIQISFQYTAHWTVYLFIASVIALAWLQRPRFPGDLEGPVRKKAWLAAMALAMLSTSYQHGALLQHNNVRGGFGKYRFERTVVEARDYAALYSLIRKVPPLSKIASTENIVPHVSARPDSYTMRIGVFDAEYLLFPDHVGRNEWIHLGPALKQGGYGVIDKAGPFFLAKLGAPTDRNKVVIRRIRH